MQVNIQQRHLDAGVPGDPVLCALAVALEELVWPDVEVVVGPRRVVFNGDDRVLLDGHGQVFVALFDQGRAQPALLNIDIPARYLRQPVSTPEGV